MRQAKTLGTYVVLLLLAAFLVAPFVWMVLISLQPSKSPIPEFAKVVPQNPAWENYKTVVLSPTVPVFRFFLNSIFVSASVVLGQLVICSMAAYSFSRHSFKFKEVLFGAFLVSMMFSGTITQIPIFLTLRSFGWLDTYWALIVPGVGSAFGVFLLRQFFTLIPKELDEAAKLDGASDWTVYSKVVMPMSKAALATLGAFAFIATWTDFFWPLIATSSLEMRTLEVGLSIFKNSYEGTNWPLQMTAAVVTLVPVLAVFLALQRYFLRGVTIGSLK